MQATSKLLLAGLGGLAAVALPLSSHAASIPWGAPTNITAASNILSTGVTALAGANFGITTGTTTVVNNGSADVEFRSLGSGQNVTLSKGINVAAASTWGNWGFNNDISNLVGNYGVVLDTNLGDEAAPLSSTMVVVASDNNRAVSGAQLHTNFKLGASGEYLALVKPDGVTVVSAFSPDFPGQIAGFSYGLNAAATHGYLAPPTPGATNGPLVPPLAAPVLSPAGSTFTTSTAVTITEAIPGVGNVIRYTTNGSEPTTSSTLYSGSAIPISGTAHLRARVFSSSGAPGAITGGLYQQLATTSNLAGINPPSTFNSDLPVVVVENFGAGAIPAVDSPTLQTARLSVYDPAIGNSTLTATPDACFRIGIKRRGNSSRDWAKAQYRFELRDETGADLDAGLLGLPADSDWTLHGPYSDKSLIRNALVFDLGRELGMEAPRTRHFELFCNLDGGDLRSSDYMGVYVLIESVAGGGISATAVAITSGGTVTVNATTTVTARTYHSTWTTTPSGATWGAPTQVTYVLGTPASAANLLVTEVNYHPANPTTAAELADPNFRNDDFEFIEVKNASGGPIDLSGMAFTDGITHFVPPTQVLAAGEYGVFVESLPAFRARYGYSLRVLGVYSDKLDNGGESVRLVDLAGATIGSITFSDTWFPTTDGGGGTLAAVNEATTGADPSDPLAWKASDHPLGTPGMPSNSVGFAGWLLENFSTVELADPLSSGALADTDGDGITSLMEFGLGLDPTLHDAPALLPTGGMVRLAGDDYMTLRFRLLKLGSDVTYRAMVSPDLHDWTEVTTEVGTPVDNRDGTETVVIRDLLKARDATRRFMRLEVER